MAIFDMEQAVGFFVGLTEGGLEFGAELTLRYDRAYQSLPMLGQFVIVALERPDEALLGRITAIGAHGRLASAAGEDVGANAVDQRRPMPEDLREQFLRYKCSVRLLGLLREASDDRIVFTPSHRRLPHMGALVMFVEGKVLQTVAGATRPGSPIGYLAFGEFIYAKGTTDAEAFGEAFQVIGPTVKPNFDAGALVARRTCVFARAGFGKSNLLKTLFSRLYEREVPTISRQGSKVEVGTLILDSDGEYFWPGSGDAAPPGLCDVVALKDRILILTDREDSRPYYQNFVVGRPRIDIRELSPALLLPCVLEGERLTHRGTESLIRMNHANWATLVDLIWAYLQRQIPPIPDSRIATLCNVQGQAADAIAGGIRNTMLHLLEMLHDPTCATLDLVREGLRAGKLVVVDLSLMRGRPATALSSVLLRYLFEYNVEQNTKADSKAIPIIALIEEAQKVLEGSRANNAPFVEWVKEGRKYDLGAVLVTQQPGAIDQEITSQADNMFVFHLLSSGDLKALQQANGHFSNDILATLLNEPIEGQGVFYTTTNPKLTYPIPFRAFHFGSVHARLGKEAIEVAGENYASELRMKYKSKPKPTPEGLPTGPIVDPGLYPSAADLDKESRDLAQQLLVDSDLGQRVQGRTFPKFLIDKWLRSQGKSGNLERLVNGIITAFNGLYGYGWSEEPKTGQKGNMYQAVVLIDRVEGLQRLENGEDPFIPGIPDSVDEKPDEASSVPPFDDYQIGEIPF